MYINIIFGSKIIYCSILYKEDHNLSLILIMIANFEKILNSKIYLVSYQTLGKLPNFKELTQKLQELWTKTLQRSLKSPLV